MVAVYYRLHADGCWRGTADSLPAWPGVTADSLRDAQAAALPALREHLAETLSVAHYCLTPEVRA